MTGLKSNLSFMSLFSATIKLTDYGLENLSLVLSIFFSYIALLRDSEKIRLYFEETAQISHTEFRFQSKRSSTDYVDEIARRMQVVPLRFILNSYPYLDFDFAHISSLVDCLTPSNCIGFLSYRCDKDEGRWMQEPVYGIQYKRYEKACTCSYLRDLVCSEQFHSARLVSPASSRFKSFFVYRFPYDRWMERCAKSRARFSVCCWFIVDIKR